MARFSIVNYYREQWKELPLPSEDVGHDTLLVVGSNIGLGFEASKYLARMQPEQLLVTCRDDQKCEQTCEALRVQTSYDRIRAFPLELSSFASVSALADTFRSEGVNRLHALVANAAVCPAGYSRTSDGWEVTLQVNFLSTALLSILMLPCLAASATADRAARLAAINSFGHFFAWRIRPWPGKTLLETLNDETYCFTMAERYVITKLLGVMFFRELAQRLPSPTPVSVSTVNPGTCRSELFRSIEELHPAVRFVFAAGKRLCAVRSADMGSRNLVHAAVAAGERERHGRYVSSYEVTEERNYVHSDEGHRMSKQLWKETITVLSTVDSRVPSIIANYLHES